MDTSSPYELPAVPPAGQIGTLAVADQSKLIQRPLTILQRARRLPLEHWLMYAAIVVFCLYVSHTFAFLQLHHVVFLLVACAVVAFHYIEFSTEFSSEYDTLMAMWKSLPGPTGSFYLDANLIVFFYEHRRMAETHETGWSETLRQVNTLLRMEWEAQFVTHDRPAFLANARQVYEKALFHFHSIVFLQSEYKVKYQMWQRAMHDLQVMLWVHLDEIRRQLHLPETSIDAVQPAPFRGGAQRHTQWVVG